LSYYVSSQGWVGLDTIVGGEVLGREGKRSETIVRRKVLRREGRMSRSNERKAKSRVGEWNDEVGVRSGQRDCSHKKEASKEAHHVEARMVVLRSFLLIEILRL